MNEPMNYFLFHCINLFIYGSSDVGPSLSRLTQYTSYILTAYTVMMIVYQEIKVSSTKHSKKTRCLVFSAQLSKHVPLRKQRKNFVFSGSITKWLPKYIAHVF